MAVTQFTISVLNSPQAVYYPGQTIDAVINLTTPEDVSFKSIYAKFKGWAHTSWSEGSGDNKRHYSASEQYFKTTVCLAGNVNGDMVMTLPAGNYSYPVRFLLPANIPSSYEGGTGYVRYLIKAKVDRRKTSDFRVQHPFTIISLLDLNQIPEARMPSTLNDTKTSCCLCCEKGPVTTAIRIDKRGFVPGEQIILNAEITNQSATPIVASVFKLRMVTTFMANASSTKRTVTVNKINRGRIEPGSSDVWSGEGLLVPATPPSFAYGCKLLDIQYVLELKADIEDTMFDIEFQLPVIIGTIPLSFTYSAPPVQPPLVNPGDISLQQMPASTPVTTQPGIDPSILPPSYEACVFGKASIQRQRSVDGQERFEDFAPVYPYYNNYVPK